MTENNEPAIRLPDGRVIRAPLAPDYCEFALPGNAKLFPGGGFWAFHDPQTDTGAIYYLQHGTWTINQPIRAPMFWLHCEIMGCTEVGKSGVEAIVQELADLFRAPAGRAN